MIKSFSIRINIIKLLSTLSIYRVKLVKLEKSVFEVSRAFQVILGQLEKEVPLAKKGLEEIQVETVVSGNPESKDRPDPKEIWVN